jgi:ABC-type Fe3+-citrate transport system substrate-binding protein
MVLEERISAIQHAKDELRRQYEHQVREVNDLKEIHEKKIKEFDRQLREHEKQIASWEIEVKREREMKIALERDSIRLRTENEVLR